jgi:hypothetical protein
MKKVLYSLPAAIVLLLAPFSLRAQNIVSTNFVSGGSNILLDGSNAGLATNQPGGNWVWGAGWNWSAPLVFATWNGGTYQNAAYLGEEDTALGLSLASSGGYSKPSQFTISSDLILSGALSNVRVGLGFWSAMPARVDDAGASSFDNFTGLVLEESTGNIQIYSGGAYQGSPVNVLGSFVEDTAYHLSYTVDTTTGAISNVLFEGNAVSGFSSTDFTNSATAFAGAMTGTQSRGYFDTFVVETASVPEPSTYVLALAGLGLLVWRRRASLNNRA